MEISQSKIDFPPRRLYVGPDGWPRHFDRSLLPEGASSYQEVREISLVAAAEVADGMVDAFKLTQRYIALGVVALGGIFSNAIHPPENIREFAFNFTTPLVVQGLNYVNFRKGLHVLKELLHPNNEGDDDEGKTYT